MYKTRLHTFQLPFLITSNQISDRTMTLTVLENNCRFLFTHEDIETPKIDPDQPPLAG